MDDSCIFRWAFLHYGIAKKVDIHVIEICFDKQFVSIKFTSFLMVFVYVSERANGLYWSISGSRPRHHAAIPYATRRADFYLLAMIPLEELPLDVFELIVTHYRASRRADASACLQARLRRQLAVL